MGQRPPGSPPGRPAGFPPRPPLGLTASTGISHPARRALSDGHQGQLTRPSSQDSTSLCRHTSSSLCLTCAVHRKREVEVTKKENVYCPCSSIRGPEQRPLLSCGSPCQAGLPHQSCPHSAPHVCECAREGVVLLSVTLSMIY